MKQNLKNYSKKHLVNKSTIYSDNFAVRSSVKQWIFRPLRTYLSEGTKKTTHIVRITHENHRIKQGVY